MWGISVQENSRNKGRSVQQNVMCVNVEYIPETHMWQTWGCEMLQQTTSRLQSLYHGKLHSIQSKVFHKEMHGSMSFSLVLILFVFRRWRWGRKEKKEGREGRNICHWCSHPTGLRHVTQTRCQLTAKDTGPFCLPRGRRGK